MVHDDNLDRAEELAREALDQNVGTRLPPMVSLGYFTVATVSYRQGRPLDALEVLATGHRALDELGAPSKHHCLLHLLAVLLFLTIGNEEAAHTEADTALVAARESRHPSTLAGALTAVGRASFSTDPDRALAAFEESIALAQAGADDEYLAVALDGAAQLRARAGDREGALSDLRAVIAYAHDTGRRTWLGISVERAIATLASIHEDELAAVCAGIAHSGVVTAFRSLPQTNRTAARIAERMGSDAYQTVYERGAALTFEDVAPILLAELDHRIATGDNN